MIDAESIDPMLRHDACTEMLIRQLQHRAASIDERLLDLIADVRTLDLIREPPVYKNNRLQGELADVQQRMAAAEATFPALAE